MLLEKKKMDLHSLKWKSLLPQRHRRKIRLRGFMNYKLRIRNVRPAPGCSAPHHLHVTNVTKNVMTIQSVKHSRLARQVIRACASAVPPRQSYLPTRDLIRTASFRGKTAEDRIKILI